MISRKLIISREGRSSNHNRSIINNNQSNNVDDFVTFDHLGKNGRLGNQMFQIAATVGVSKYYGVKAIFPEWKCAYTGTKFYEFFKNPIDQYDNIVHSSIYNEPDFSFNHINYTKNMTLRGYFQSDKYFRHCEDDIKQIFDPKKSFIDGLGSRYPQILLGNTCSLHVRRGDYIGNPVHNVCDTDYYHRSINMMKSMSNVDKFFVFSDDIEWCMENFRGDEFFFVTGNLDIEDLYLMSLCKNNIIPNSTFSWWASWLNLNPNKIIIAPNKWFTDFKNINYKDIYTENMTRI